MPNNDAGGKKTREKMIEKFGSEEAYKEHMRNIGKKGGGGSSGYEFGHGKVDPAKVGKVGADTRWGKRNATEDL